MTAILRITQLSAFCLAIALFSTASRGDDKLSYVLAPLRTELHRSEISSKASALLVVNATAFETNSIEDSISIPCVPLEADLRRLSAKSDALLLILIQHTGSKRLEKDAVVRLKEQLKELARTCGYRDIQFAEEWTSTEWELGSGSLGSGLMDDPGHENLIVNKTLVAAPLRTRISKLRIGAGDAFIELRRPIDARNLELSDHTKVAIRHAVQSMGLDSTHQLDFHVSSTKAGAQAVERLFSNRLPPAIPEDASPAIKALLLKERESFEISPALKFAQELGFQKIGYRHSPNGGAPEFLLDAEAPNFELKGLDGNMVKWSEWRRDRPALISFWGVACGPCRLEAPHLSRLHEKYGDDVAILGINAYDETEETVLAFVTQEKLKHQIVVGGRELAKSTYHVGAYPTTFWINRHGEVVRYAFGFENGEELETDLIEFLANGRP